VSREGKRPLAATVAVVLGAALLVACGSSDSDSSGTTGATTTGSTTTAQDGGGKQGQDDQDQSGSPGKSQGQGQDGGHQSQNSSQGNQPDGSAHPRNVATPLQVSGGGSAQFRTKGGDNSIQEFGDEDESELREVAEIVHGFYVSRAEERWDAACSYLAKSNIEQLEQLASQAPQLKSAGCGTVLKAFTRPLPASVQREITTVDAGSFRREGEQGFFIYYGAGHTAYAMPLREEDGTWKVTALSGSTLG
jgi:hypothetical protein